MKHVRKAAWAGGEKIALAASSLSALALLPAGAQAGIVYNNTSIQVTPSTHTTWDVDGVGGAEFSLQGGLSNNYGMPGVRLNTNTSFGGNGNVVLNGRGIAKIASWGPWIFHNLAPGLALGPTLAGGYDFGRVPHGWRGVATAGITQGAKNFTSGVPGYFGFQFTDAGGSNLYYGWAQITIDGPNNTYTINDWAYNSTAGGSINVGQTTGGASVPEPGTLSLTLLGLGAAGVRSWRGRKQRQALAA